MRRRTNSSKMMMGLCTDEPQSTTHTGKARAIRDAPNSKNMPDELTQVPAESLLQYAAPVGIALPPALWLVPIGKLTP